MFQCPGSGVRVTDRWLPGVGFYCPTCGRRSTVTARGKIPRHNRGPHFRRVWSHRLRAYTYDGVSASECQCTGSTPCKCGKFHAERQRILASLNN